jgi:hypothetical protein
MKCRPQSLNDYENTQRNTWKFTNYCEGLHEQRQTCSWTSDVKYDSIGAVTPPWFIQKQLSVTKVNAWK